MQLQLDAFDRSRDLAAAVELAVTEVIAIGQHLDLDADPRAEVEVEVVGVELATEVVIAVDHLVESADPARAGDDPTEVLPWQPVFDEHDDLHGLLKARGRLLSRAFHGVGADDR